MTDPTAYEQFELKASDPKLAELLAEHTDLVGIVDLHRCVFRSIGHLNLHGETFQEFIREAVGGPYATHKLRNKEIAFYYANDLQHEGDRSQFNTTATMLLASWAAVPLEAIHPVYGTALVTGCDPATWLPRPLDQGQAQVMIADVVENAQVMEVARGLISQPGTGSV